MVVVIGIDNAIVPTAGRTGATAIGTDGVGANTDATRGADVAAGVATEVTFTGSWALTVLIGETDLNFDVGLVCTCGIWVTLPVLMMIGLFDAVLNIVGAVEGELPMDSMLPGTEPSELINDGPETEGKPLYDMV